MVFAIVAMAAIARGVDNSPPESLFQNRSPALEFLEIGALLLVIGPCSEVWLAMRIMIVIT